MCVHMMSAVVVPLLVTGVGEMASVDRKKGACVLACLLSWGLLACLWKGRS